MPCQPNSTGNASQQPTARGRNSEDAVRAYFSGRWIPDPRLVRGGVGNAVDLLSRERSPRLLIVDASESRFFAVAVSLQHATGGSLTNTLENMAEMIRRRRAMRMKAKAMVSEVRMFR